MADMMARKLALSTKNALNNLEYDDIGGLGSAAAKDIGTGAGQIPLTDSGGKILIDVIPDCITCGETYKGLWDASTGVYPTPTTVGELYVVSTEGTIGEETYRKNDQIIWNGATWDHIDNAQLITFAEDIKRIGFVDRTSTNAPYLSGTSKDVVNLDDAGAGWSYYRNGDKYTVSGNRTVELPNGAGNAHDDGIYWITISNGDGNLAVSNEFPCMMESVFVAYVYWNSSLAVGHQSLIADERHTILWDSSVHETFHSILGAEITNDIEMSDYQLDSILDSTKQFSLSSTNIRDEDISLDVDALTGGNGVYTNFYRTADNIWGWETEADFPYRYTTNGRMIYDTSTGGIECSDGKFINTFIAVTNLTDDSRYISFTSQNEYDTLTEAIEEHCLDLDIDGFFYNECVLAFKLTWQTDDTFTPSTGKCKIVAIRSIMENYLTLKSLNKTTTSDVDSAIDRRYVTDLEKVAITHSNRTSLDVINQELATTSDVTFNDIDVNDLTATNVEVDNLKTTGYTISAIGNITLTSGNTNNLVIPETDIVRITSTDGNINLTGIAGGVDGRRLVLYNLTDNDIDIPNDSTLSTAENRILTMDGTIRGSGEGVASFFYDGTQNRWVMISDLL